MGSDGTDLNAGPDADLPHPGGGRKRPKSSRSRRRARAAARPAPANRRPLRDAALALSVLVLAGLILVCARPRRDDFPTPAAARAALARDPLDIAAIRSLGLMRDREGGDSSADALLDFAGRRTWRDAPTQVWLVQRRLEQGRYAEALRRADALLRQDDDGAARRTLFPLLVAALSQEAIRPDLAARLAQTPGWRGDFLRGLGDAGEPADILALFETLAAGPAPLRPEEYAPFVNRLATARDIPAAYAAWIAARGARSASAAAFDAAFSGPPDGTPFTWSLARGAGARTTASVDRLEVAYDGVSSPTLPARMLVLAPGAYRLTWLETSARAATGGVFWRLRCAGSEQVIARTSPPSHSPSPSPGARGERAAALDFAVPAGTCAGVWLELVADPGERPSDATFTFRQMRLERRL